MSALPTESIILVSGLPGHGKTLFAVDLARKYSAEGTRVFSWGLDGASSDLFEVLPDDWSFSDWQKFPPGSVVIFDEAHKLLPTRTSGAPPKSISDLTEIRHFGLRFIFITQDPRNLDVFVRRLIGRHFHITRKMGFPGAVVRSFDRVADDPTDYHMVKNSTSEVWKYPKELFKLYKSATLHVVKPKMPKKVIFFGSIAVVGVLFALYVLFTYGSKVSNGDIIPGVDVAEEKIENLGSGSSAEVDLSFDTAEEYMELTTPLSPVAPWTAPVYEEVRTVPRLPGKLNCIASDVECRCYTDQMTRVHLDTEICMAMIFEGIYSPYHEPYSGGGGRAPGTPPGQPSYHSIDDGSSAGANAVVISQPGG